VEGPFSGRSKEFAKTLVDGLRKKGELKNVCFLIKEGGNIM